MIALASFTNWITAALYFVALGILVACVLRFHERHHRSEAFDDRLTDERMREAREYLIRVWGGDKQDCE